jgi:wobble nucleotide-excising tRNase
LIVWIDDPISSLDGNHIFFVYGLINEHLNQTIDCEQLFISTHSLDFLKYLHRLPGKRSFFTVERRDDQSTLAPMPNYMKKYVTEFNYLFEQIYRCATATEINDENYREFYGFGNNARKFLELYLYYCYPDETTEDEKRKRFFGNLEIPAVLTDRINNEYSHMAGVFERGSTLLVQPEMQLCAKLICDRLSQNRDQYQALLRSIGRLEGSGFELDSDTTEPMAAE